MATTVYRSGEAGTLGFRVTDPQTGGPWDASGLGARMVIYLPGADLVIAGQWLTGQQILINGAVTEDATVMAFTISTETIPLAPNLYRAALQIEDGASGWRTLPDGDFNLEVRRP